MDTSKHNTKHLIHTATGNFLSSRSVLPGTRGSLNKLNGFHHKNPTKLVGFTVMTQPVKTHKTPVVPVRPNKIKNSRSNRVTVIQNRVIVEPLKIDSYAQKVLSL